MHTFTAASIRVQLFPAAAAAAAETRFPSNIGQQSPHADVGFGCDVREIRLVEGEVAVDGEAR